MAAISWLNVATFAYTRLPFDALNEGDPLELSGSCLERET